MLELHITGGKKLENLGRNLRKNLNKGIKDGMEEIGKHMKKIIRADLDKKSKGRMVTRYSPTRRVRTSLPNHSPNNDRRNLRRSIDFDMINYDEIKVGSGIKYAKFLEEGTSKMIKRPFIGINIERESKNISNILAQSIQDKLDEL